MQVQVIKSNCSYRQGCMYKLMLLQQFLSGIDWFFGFSHICVQISRMFISMLRIFLPVLEIPVTSLSVTIRSCMFTFTGLYPLVGWVIRDETVFIAEGNTIGTSASIELSKTIGLFDEVSLSSDMAYSVQDSNGVYFVPAFNGLQAPVNDPRAVTLLLGMCEMSLCIFSMMLKMK